MLFVVTVALHYASGFYMLASVQADTEHHARLILMQFGENCYNQSRGNVILSETRVERTNAREGCQTVLLIRRAWYDPDKPRGIPERKEKRKRLVPCNRDTIATARRMREFRFRMS